MRSARIQLLGVSLAFGLGVFLGCEKQESRSPGDEGNLCTDYKTCNECIAGLKTKGATEGEAETQCGAAVLGCWTTWDKPIVCGEKKHDTKPEA